MGSHNLYVNHGYWSDFGEEVEAILDVSLTTSTDLWPTATDRGYQLRDDRARRLRRAPSKIFVVDRERDGDGDEERTETEEKTSKPS